VQIQQTQMLLNKLVEMHLSEEDQLVLVITIRRVISGSEEPPIEEIMASTNLIQIVSQMLKFSDATEEVRIMKLEAIWILTNLAYGS